MPHTMESICRKLHSSDYRITPQRQTILKVFIENASKHLSAEEIYYLVKEKHPEVSLATVYRTLDLLAELGILQKMNFNDGRSRYEFTEQDNQHLHHHHHMICLRCGKVTEFEDILLDSLEDVIAKRTNFKIVDHHVKFFGFCENCRRQ